MARGEVFIVLPGSDKIKLWRTDLTGHGSIRLGAEFTIRELWQWGRNNLVPNGRKLLVRIASEHSRLGVRTPVFNVEIVKDLSPEKVESAKPLFE